MRLALVMCVKDRLLGLVQGWQLAIIFESGRILCTFLGKITGCECRHQGEILAHHLIAADSLCVILRFWIDLTG